MIYQSFVGDKGVCLLVIEPARIELVWVLPVGRVVVDVKDTGDDGAVLEQFYSQNVNFKSDSNPGVDSINKN